MHTRWDQKHICFIAHTHTKINIHVCIYVCVYIYCDLQPSCTTAAFPVTLLLSQQFCVNVPYDPRYGRPGADLRRESEDAAEPPARPFVTITRRQHTNIVVQSQSQCQIAFGLQLYSSEHLSLSGSLWNHTQARAHTRGDTHAHRRARRHVRARTQKHTHARTHIHTHTHIHTRWIKHWTRTKWSDIAACTGVRGKSRGSRGGFLPWAFCRGVSHHHTFSYFSEFTKIVSKAVCG